MKKFLSTITFLAFAATVLSQEQIKNKDYYLGKSKRQKTAAYSLLIGGTAAMGIGYLVGSGKNVSFGDAGTAVILGGVGLLSVIGSIPLFIASGKNKRKASLMVSTSNIPFNPQVRSSKKQLNVGITFSL